MDFVRTLTDPEEQQVLEGGLFTCDQVNTGILTTAKIEYWFRVPVGKKIVMRVKGWASARARVTLHEGVSNSDFGTVATAFNRDRSPGAPIATTLVYTGPTITGDGTTIMDHMCQGRSTEEHAFLLDAADYCLRLVNLDAGTQAGSLSMEFYELPA